jgi:hypothetical protein
MYEGPHGQVGSAYAVTFWIMLAVVVIIALAISLRA